MKNNILHAKINANVIKKVQFTNGHVVRKCAK